MQDDEQEPTPFDLIRAFERCVNYPREEDGVIALAQALRKAADSSSVAMADIVTRCVQLSEYCPTDHDLLSIASEIKAARLTEEEAKSRDDQEQKWRKQYGAPQKFSCEWSLLDSRKAHDERDAMTKAIAKHLGISSNHRNPNRRSMQFVSWHDWFTAQTELGHPLTSEQAKYL